MMDTVSCPYCGEKKYVAWAEELGFRAVRCKECALIYVNPRPNLATISTAVKTGAHGEGAQHLNVKSRRISSKVLFYHKVFERIFDDIWNRNQPISWLDVGAGYGEVLEAVSRLAPVGSNIEGLEPMKPKAEQARSRGLKITEDYLRPTHPKVGFVSSVNVFSHIPNFGEFLRDVKNVLEPRGEVFIETGNLADLNTRNEFPGELGLPDHLVFAGESQLCGYLERAGFEIIRVEKLRDDGLENLAKNIVKKIIGRPSTLRLPYTSSYRQLLVRARLRSDLNQTVES
jgi:SAM-dependent methyltransferase